MELREKIADIILDFDRQHREDEFIESGACAAAILELPEIKEALASKKTVDHINETYAKSVESAARSRPMV